MLSIGDAAVASDLKLPLNVGHILLGTRRLCQIVAAVLRFYIFHWLWLGRAVRPEVRLRLFLEHLGGAWTKIGQGLSLRFDLLPSEYCAELLKLLNQTATVPYATVRQIVLRELGAFPEQLFAAFNPVPHAAASIAQVHIATTRDGETLAIKVQRPHVAEQFEADFRVLRIMAGVTGYVNAFQGTALRLLSDEFERWSREELDFLTEARNCHRLLLRSEGDPIQVCAEVRFEFCSKRVLATKLLTGVSLLDIINAAREKNPEALRALNLRSDDLNKIGRNFFWSISNQIYRDGVFHADPHPANVFVLPGNRIGFIDFGNTGYLSGALRSSLVENTVHIYRGNIDQAVKVMFQLLIPLGESDLGQAREDMFDAYQRYRRGLGVAKANARALNSELLVSTMTIARRHHLVMPQELSMYFKTVLTMDAVLAELAPEYDWFSDLPKFFEKGLISDLRERIWRWPEVVTATRHRARRSLSDANSLTASFRFFDPALKSMQIRAVFYGIWSIAFCVGSFLAAKDDLSFLGDMLGVSNRLIISGFITAAIISLLRMQRQIRRILKIRNA